MFKPSDMSDFSQVGTHGVPAAGCSRSQVPAVLRPAQACPDLRYLLLSPGRSMMQDQAWRLYETCSHITDQRPFELEGMLTGSTGKSMAVTLRFRWGPVTP